MGDKKLQLMAVVDVSQDIVKMQKAGKKLFSSIEPTLNFINKGIAYLTGLGFTDTPASIGTESMKFSANQGKDGIYSFAEEISIEWEGEANPAAGDSLFSKVMGLLNFSKKDNENRFADISKAVEAIAQSQKEILEKFAAGSDKAHIAEIEKLTQKVAELEKAHNAFKAEVEKMTDGKPTRPAATGGKGEVVTDC